MLQKELAKRLKSRYDTKMDGDGWLAVSSDGMPLCRVKYNGNYIVNDNPYLSEEYLGKIAEVQNELLTVKDYVALYEHAQQMKAADVSEYRQLPPSEIRCWQPSTAKATVLNLSHGNRTQTVMPCFGEITLRAMNTPRSPLPCAQD